MRTYDPKQVIVSFGGVQLVGYAKGEFTASEMNEDAYTVEVGSGGNVTRVRSRNVTGTVTITLLRESPSNTYLQTKRELDKKFNLGTGTLQILNINGDELALAPVAWIKKDPKQVNSDTASPREWVFECEELILEAAGALS
jgi:hypothetical protein